MKLKKLSVVVVVDFKVRRIQEVFDFVQVEVGFDFVEVYFDFYIVRNYSYYFFVVRGIQDVFGEYFVELIEEEFEVCFVVGFEVFQVCFVLFDQVLCFEQVVQGLFYGLWGWVVFLVVRWQGFGRVFVGDQFVIGEFVVGVFQGNLRLVKKYWILIFIILKQ